MHVKINVQGLEHVKISFSHARLYNDHKYKSIFMNFMIGSLIAKCISCWMKHELVFSELYLAVVCDLEHEKILNNLCDVYFSCV